MFDITPIVQSAAVLIATVIVSLNRLTSNVIYSGQNLKIPN